MALSQHPLLATSFAGLHQLPTQAISSKDKLKNKKKNGGYSDWERQNLDALEQIAYAQYTNNHRYITNEKIVNGEFITEDYYDCDEKEQLEPLEQLIRDGKVPKFIKNYNIVAKIINMLVSIFEEYPDVFHIVGYGETFQSEKSRKQSELLKEWFDAKIEENINSIVEPIAEDSDEETKQQYQQQRDQMKQYLTPEDIGQYMKNFRHDYELWAEYKMLDYKFKFDTPKLRKNEYRDFLINGVRARHFRVTPYGLQQETINPRNLFYQKSDGVEYIQDGDYAGLVYKSSPQRVLDLFSKILSSEDIIKINSVYTELNSEETKGTTKDIFGNVINYIPINGVPYNTTRPYNNQALNNMAPNLGMNYSVLDPFDLNGLTSYSISSTDSIITEAYWKSQEKIYTISWINPETNIHEIIDVDEEFVFPSYIKIKRDLPSIGEIPFNTAIEGWNTVIYGGIKIRLLNSEAIYLKTGILEYQKTSPNQIIPKIPIFGQISNNRNVVVRGLVDQLKPYIFLHNIAMNKASKYQERGFLPFIAMDMKILSRQHDWGTTEEGEIIQKWMELGEDLGIAPVDTSVVNTMGENASGGQFPRVVDIDLTPRVVEQLNIARSIVQVAYEQIGISQQLLGNIKSTESATGVNAGIIQSQNTVSHWISSFFDCEKEIIQYSLEVAQWLEANNKEISVEYANSDYTTGLLKIANTNFNLFDWRIYVVNSQEELQRKKIFKEMAVGMNTLSISTTDRLEMTNTLTPSEKIIKIIKASEERAQAMEQQQLKLKQDELAAKDTTEKARIVQEEKLLKLKLDSEERQAWIKSKGYLSDEQQDTDNNKIPDAFEYHKFETQSDKEYQKLGLAKDKIKIDREKENQRINENQQKMLLEQQKLALKDKQIEQTAKNVKILDD